MKQVKLAGKKVPAIGIGTWHMGDVASQRSQEIAAIRSGIDAGAQVIDTAEMYGSGRSEDLVGEAWQPYDRGSLFLISKVLPENASQVRMRTSLMASLRRLRTDYVDLYLYHWRGNVPLAETVATLQGLQDEGLTKAWGISNFDRSDLQELWQLPQGKQAAANEDLYHIGSRGLDYDILPWQRAHDLPLIAYSPIAQGDTRGQHLSRSQALRTVAARHDASIYQIMLAWAIRDGHTVAIPQTSSMSHMHDNLAATTLTLTPADLELLDQDFPAPTQSTPLAVI
ncbi:aldo keto reductase [Levilactobacillus senmaizukei DSM 21775 = NBRC 103853]|uniref:Aldo keto reductase n=1 Tax=Levilactobacillus senmaizukei DSM 21775 = NBRC 103853 TaxID=1423803 RepID=A0A0R2DBT3_9LACO|nr:aldo/keto reductase [Levilactobacillus senmaizukei]KRN01185.1 aldo keto reductase [Levilactobacillus senmaizukei DSM 21775 = NBRC 103853]